MNFLPLSRFLIIVSNPACIENRNHFQRHRDQILIGSLVNSKQVNGEALQKEIFTSRLLLYVYVGYPDLPPPPPKKLAGSASISGILWQKWGGHVHPSPPVATPLVIDDSTTFPGRLDFRVAWTKTYQFLSRI